MTLLVLLLILVVTFGVVRVAGARAGHRVNASRAGQISLALLFLFTGLGHFAETEQMAKMLPPELPGRTAVILVSGLIEWMLAFALLTPRYAFVGGVAAIVFLVVVFPGNVYAALNRVDFGGHGAGPVYLWVRAPFQVLLIVWAYVFAVRRGAR